jgi:riboflavin synthase
MSMFTGIVSGVGEVAEAGPVRLAIRHAEIAARLEIGSSVAVNGCCLTVTEKRGEVFYADVVPESRSRTNLGRLAFGNGVNLELPLSPGSLLDGHLVQGHVDATATVRAVADVTAGREIVIELPEQLRDLVAEKGSVAVDGVSLTVAGVDDGVGCFKVALIPYTLAATIAGGYSVGSLVNVEADVIARYVARILRR